MRACFVYFSLIFLLVKAKCTFLHARFLGCMEAFADFWSINYKLKIIHMKNLFILLLSLLVLSSCGKSNSNSSDGVVTIEIGSPDKKEVKLSSLVDSVSYIPLETKNDLLIGQLAKLIVSDDYIYILGAGEILRGCPHT